MTEVAETLIDCSPKPSMLKSIIAQRPNYMLLAGEAIDNAFDADAHDIVADFGAEEISFRDDGVGITKDRELAIVTVGDHAGMPSTALGRYGVGIKYQAMACGSVLDVHSISLDGHLRMAVDWDDIVRLNQFKVPKPLWTSTLPNAKRFTKVAVRKLRPRLPAVRIDDLAAKIADLFHPALVSGRSITLNGKPIEATLDPRLSSVIDERREFSHGKAARIRAGLLADPSSRRRMVHVGYRHRIIMPGKAFGCGEYSGPIFARVDLSGPWQITAFKDDLSDEERDDLEDAIYEILRPLLEQSRSRSMEAVIDDMMRRLNEKIPPDLRPVRPPHKKEKSAPIDHPRKRKKHGIAPEAPDASTGPARAQRSPRDRLIIVFADMDIQKFGYGEFDGTGRPHRITLAKNNPRIAALLSQRDREEATTVLYEIAMAIYLYERAKNQLDVDNEAFGLRYWQLVERQDAASGSAVA